MVLDGHRCRGVCTAGGELWLQLGNPHSAGYEGDIPAVVHPANPGRILDHLAEIHQELYVYAVVFHVNSGVLLHHLHRDPSV